MQIMSMMETGQSRNKALPLGRLDGSESWELLPEGPLGLAPRAGGHPRMDPCPQHKVCCTDCSAAFFHLGGFHPNQGTRHQLRGGCAHSTSTRSVQLSLRPGERAGAALLRYLRPERHRALVPILPTVQDFTHTPRTYRECHSRQLRRWKRGVRHRPA